MPESGSVGFFRPSTAVCEIRWPNPSPIENFACNHKSTILQKKVNVWEILYVALLMEIAASEQQFCQPTQNYNGIHVRGSWIQERRCIWNNPSNLAVSHPSKVEIRSKYRFINSKYTNLYSAGKYCKTGVFPPALDHATGNIIDGAKRRRVKITC